MGMVEEGLHRNKSGKFFLEKCEKGIDFWILVCYNKYNENKETRYTPMKNTIRRSVKYVSFKHDANFFFHYEGRKIVGASVSGSDLPVSGFVSMEVFNALLAKVQERDGVTYQICKHEHIGESEYINHNRKPEPKEVSGLTEVQKTFAKKVNKTNYKMAVSEYRFSYLPEKF